MPALTPPALPTSPPRLTRGVTWLVAALLAVEFLQYTLFQPSDVQATLGFRRVDLDDGRWWSVATFMFAHASVSLTLFNAYALTLFGPRLERFWGTRRFLVFVGLAAIGGWIMHLFIGGDSLMLGASASAFGVLTANALRWGGEEHELAGGFTMSGRWLAALVGAIILLVGLQDRAGGAGGPAFAAHLGGMIAAWFFMRATKVLLVERFREGVSAVPDEPPEDQPPRAVPKTLPRSRSRERETIDDVVARSNAAAARRTPAPTRRAAPETEDPRRSMTDIDTILDKISAHGIEHLTPDERRVLDDHSRRLRDG
ncbi:MAG: rhomboid family intramembrane serine protease [Gemmatimonadaceae bacterium]